MGKGVCGRAPRLANRQSRPVSASERNFERAPRNSTAAPHKNSMRKDGKHAKLTSLAAGGLLGFVEQPAVAAY